MYTCLHERLSPSIGDYTNVFSGQNIRAYMNSSVNKYALTQMDPSILNALICDAEMGACTCRDNIPHNFIWDPSYFPFVDLPCYSRNQVQYFLSVKD